jgi:hypothetical protein
MSRSHRTQNPAHALDLKQPLAKPRSGRESARLARKVGMCEFTDWKIQDKNRGCGREQDRHGKHLHWLSNAGWIVSSELQFSELFCCCESEFPRHNVVALRLLDVPMRSRILKSVVVWGSIQGCNYVTRIQHSTFASTIYNRPASLTE